MKNTKLFALGLLGASMFMTSCNDDPEEEAIPPIVTVTASTDDTEETSDAITVSPGEMVTFDWTARSGDADLDRFRVFEDGTSMAIDSTGEGNEIPNDIASGDQSIYNDNITIMADSQEGTTEYTFEVTDADGLTASETVTVTVEGESTDLTDPAAFTWQREGGSAGTGLDQFGLQWTNNTATSAIVKKDAATKLVELNSSDWNDITTVEGLSAAIEAAADMTQYDGVSAEQDGTYDDVLGVRYNDEYYLLHVTNGDVETAGTGTTITITGEYKEQP